MFQRDVQLRFDGVRGSVPEFSNVAVDPQSTLPNTDTLVGIYERSAFHPHQSYDTIYYTICYFNVRSQPDMSQLNLPHGTNN